MLVRSGLWTVIYATPLPLATRCSGLPPPWHVQSFSKNRWENGENPTHDVSCWHLVESKTCDYARLKSIHIYCSTVLISFLDYMSSPNIFFWNNLVWSMNNCILQEEFSQAINDNQQNFPFRSVKCFTPKLIRVLYYWTISESIQP